LSPLVKKALVLFLLAEIILAAVNAYVYFGGFDGDPQIHMSFAENASRGRWFRFNPDETVSGVTSLFWMFAGAFGWFLAGIKGCLIVYDGLILLGWLGGAVCLGYLVFRWGGHRIFGVLAGTLYLGYPGIAANGLTGMENMTFAFFVYVFILAYALFDERRRLRARRTALQIGLGALLALIVLTRPEGMVVVAAFAAVEVGLMLCPINREDIGGRFRALCLIGAVFILIIMPFGIFHYAVTHKVMLGSGLARLMHSRRLSTSVHLLGPLWFYPWTLARLVIYLPVAAGLALAAWRSLARRPSAPPGHRGLPGCPSWHLSAWTAVLGVGLYSFVTGAVHTNRYTIWIVGLSTAIFFTTAGRVLLDGERAKLLPAIVLAGIFWMGAVSVGEGLFRLRRGDHTKLLRWDGVIETVKDRRQRSDELIRVLESEGWRIGPRKVGILLQEIQARLAYDDRITIFSRDGRTQDLRYGRSGCPDLTPILKDPDLLVIMDDINGGTIQGCIKDEAGLKLAQLYENPNILETDEWKKVWLPSFQGSVSQGSATPDSSSFPVLIRKFR
jgi:hypothetical protein